MEGGWRENGGRMTGGWNCRGQTRASVPSPACPPYQRSHPSLSLFPPSPSTPLLILPPSASTTLSSIQFRVPYPSLARSVCLTHVSHSSSGPYVSLLCSVWLTCRTSVFPSPSGHLPLVPSLCSGHRPIRSPSPSGHLLHPVTFSIRSPPLAIYVSP